MSCFGSKSAECQDEGPWVVVTRSLAASAPRGGRSLLGATCHSCSLGVAKSQAQGAKDVFPGRSVEGPHPRGAGSSHRAGGNRPRPPRDCCCLSSPASRIQPRAAVADPPWETSRLGPFPLNKLDG